MTFRGYRDGSRDNWGSPNGILTLDQVNTGALLRIADATEKMAQRYTELIRDRDYWERRAKGAERALETERRRSASLRGHLARAKRAKPTNQPPACPADISNGAPDGNRDGLAPITTERTEA